MKKLSQLAEYVALSIGGALAASSFAILSDLLSLATGIWLLLAIVLSGVLCMVISASVAELASMYPSAPGIRTYLKAAYGDRMSLFLTFLALLMVPIFAGVESYICMLTIKGVFPSLSLYWAVTVVFVVVISLNLAGIEIPRRTQMVMVFTFVLSVIGIGICAICGSTSGILSIAPRETAGGGVSLLNLGGAMGGAIFLFMGFEWVTPLGRSPAAYKHMIPISMPLAIGFLILMFVLFSAGLTLRLTPVQITGNQTPHLVLGTMIFGPRGDYAMAFLSILAMLTTFNAGLMGASRLIYGISREGVLPPWLSQVSLSTGLPFRTILLVGFAGLFVALVELYYNLHMQAALICAAIYCLLYSSLLFAVPHLRRRDAAAKRSFSSPVPTVLQGAVGVVMLLLGFATVFSKIALGRTSFLWLCQLMVFSLILTLYLARRRDKRRIVPPQAKISTVIVEGGEVGDAG